MKRRISQKQIAADLEVSQSLVSLVLNGRRDGISEESYQRIWSHAMKSGYAPKGMNPGLAPQFEPDSGYVGVFLRAGIKLANQSNTYSHVSQGLHGVLRKSGISTVYLGTEGEIDEAEFLRILHRRNPLRGIVLYGEVKPGFIKAIAELQHEIVSVYASYPGLCHSVLPNERQAVEHILTYLSELGHTRFAWLGGNQHLGRNRARLQALREALHLRGLELKPEAIVNLAEGERQDGYDAAATLMKQIGRREKPTAWITHNGLMARGALQFALQQGIRIPQDVSLAAIDMTRVCEEIHPYLTSASANPEGIGARAAQLLSLTPPAGEARVFSDLVLPATLAVRETCARAPAPRRKATATRSRK